jgi:DivIVA domain-containing protein
MPLTPAEVHNVAFKKPPIGKRGYDEEEVDAFLDIVEAELARLIEENTHLKSDAGVVLRKSGAEDDTAPSAELAASEDENRRLQAQVAELERTLAELPAGDGAQPQIVALQQQLAQTEQQLEQAQQSLAEAQAAGGAGTAEGLEGATQIPVAEIHVQAVQVLALAQQTAEQHLAQCRADAERLLSEANAIAESTLSEAMAQSEKQVGDAQARATQLDEESASRARQAVQEAEERAASITAHIEASKESLERRVEELRAFEREYRTRLKSYLESQLRDLDAGGPAEPDGAFAEVQQG